MSRHDATLAALSLALLFAFAEVGHAQDAATPNPTPMPTVLSGKIGKERLKNENPGMDPLCQATTKPLQVAKNL